MSLRIVVFVLALSLAGCATSKVVSRSPANAPAAASSATTKPSAAIVQPPASKPLALPEPERFDDSRTDLQEFIADVARRRGLAASEIEAVLTKGRKQPRIIEIMTKPAESVLRWHEYSAKLVTAERMDAGARFWTEHRDALERTSQRTGVEPQYVVAIIGIETYYGRNKGSWRVLDALMTLGFDYPPRAKFFRSELEQFLLLTREEKIDPQSALGSYAGAMGGPQFMPSSYRNYAIDGDGDGRRDLFNDWDDVIASVANYFAVHGWQRGAPVLAEAEAPADVAAALDRRNLDLKDTVGALRSRNVTLDAGFDAALPAILLPAEGPERLGVRVGFKNFQVITRYNRSILYAMAVHDLATGIAQRMQLSANAGDAAR